MGTDLKPVFVVDVSNTPESAKGLPGQMVKMFLSNQDNNVRETDYFLKLKSSLNSEQ